MASDWEIERVRKDKEQWRAIVKRLSWHVEHELLEERHACFIESLGSRDWLDALSYPQAEWLLDARDSVALVSEYRRCSVRFLIQASYENRFGLDDEDQAWITRIHHEGRASLRRRDAQRLYHMTVQLGAVEDDWAD